MDDKRQWHQQHGYTPPQSSSANHKMRHTTNNIQKYQTNVRAYNKDHQWQEEESEIVQNEQTDGQCDA